MLKLYQALTADTEHAARSVCANCPHSAGYVLIDKLRRSFEACEQCVRARTCETIDLLSTRLRRQKQAGLISSREAAAYYELAHRLDPQAADRLRAQFMRDRYTDTLESTEEEAE